MLHETKAGLLQLKLTPIMLPDEFYYQKSWKLKKLSLPSGIFEYLNFQKQKKRFLDFGAISFAYRKRKKEEIFKHSCFILEILANP